MEIHYDIELKDEGKNSSISYLADSFSIDEHRILRVKSRDCGDITVQIDPNERVIINDVIVTDEWDELIEDMERQKVEDKDINYNNVEFPERAKYVRHENRIYFATDCQDGEELIYYGRCEKPSSNAMGYREYKDSKGYVRLIHYKDIVAI